MTHRAADRCAACPRLCRHVCPVALATASEAGTPTARLALVRGVAAGTLPLTSEVAERFWQCSGCRRSHAHCDLDVDKEEAILVARADAFGRGMAPQAARRLAERFAATANPTGGPLPDPPPDQPGRGGVLVFAGCATLRFTPGVPIALSRLLAAAGVPHRFHRGARPCTGYPLLAAGDLAGFEANARALVRELKAEARGCRAIVSPCPSCVWTLTERLRLSAMHSTTFLASLPLPTMAASRTVTYHDPCHLARHLGEVEAPRRLLVAAGARIVEPAAHGTDTACSGAGFGLPLAFPAMAEAIARLRSTDLAAAGHEIATACPSAAHLLSRVSGRPVRDVVEIAAESLP